MGKNNAWDAPPTSPHNPSRLHGVQALPHRRILPQADVAFCGFQRWVECSSTPLVNQELIGDKQMLLVNLVNQIGKSINMALNWVSTNFAKIRRLAMEQLTKNWLVVSQLYMEGLYTASRRVWRRSPGRPGTCGALCRGVWSLADPTGPHLPPPWVR